MNVLIKWISKFNDLTESGCKHFGVLLVAVMTIMVLIQVFFRYVLNNSFVWTEEVARFMMVWMTFIAAPVAYRKGANVSLDIVRNLFKGRLHAFIGILIEIAALATLCLFFYKSLGMFERGINIRASSIEISMAYVYVSMPIGLLLTAIVNVEIILKDISLLINPHDVDEPHHYEFSGE